MKKISLSLLLSAVVSSSLLADNFFERGDVDFSVGTIEFANEGTRSPSVGLDVKGENEIYNGLYYGLGASVEIFKYKGDIPGVDNPLGMLADIYPTLSYDLTNDLNIHASYGYTVGEFESITFDGWTKGVGIDYKLNKNWKLGLNYKNSDVNLKNLDGKVDVERMNLSFYYKY